MTQEVQPLTWQKRTNIEEHMQFFSKINEIIDNLAPTVEEAEQAIAQATAAIASANDAIATANAASAAASAAASQAQTAASTVAGYDARLTTAEGDIDSLQAADQTMAGNITALGTRMTAVESKNTQQDTAIGMLQTKNNQQDAAIGELQTADAQNVKINAINQYAIGLTGDQVAFGDKSFVITPAGNRNGVSNTFGYKRVFRSVSNSLETITQVIFGRVFNRNTNEMVNWVATFRRGGSAMPTLTIDKTVGLLIALTTDGYVEIWCSNSRFNITIDAYFGDNNLSYKNAKNDFSTEIVVQDDPPAVGDDYQYVVTAVIV